MKKKSFVSSFVQNPEHGAGQDTKLDKRLCPITGRWVNPEHEAGQASLREIKRIFMYLINLKKLKIQKMKTKFKSH